MTRRIRGRYRRQRANRNRKITFRRVAYAVELLVYVTCAAFFSREFYVFLRDSSRFQVQAVVIEGLDALSESALLEQSGITGADNVIFFDLEGVETRITAMPYVRSCGVGLAFPDTVILRIWERQPHATLMVNSRAYEIDRERVVLRECQPGEMPGEPFLTNVEGVNFVTLGEQLSQPALIGALSVWDAFSQTAMASAVSVSEIAAFHLDDIRMYLDDAPYELRWGRGNFARQARRLDILWRQLGPHLGCREYLDLRFGTELACK